MQVVLQNNVVLETLFRCLGMHHAPILRLVCRQWRDESDRVFGKPNVHRELSFIRDDASMEKILMLVRARVYARCFRYEPLPRPSGSMWFDCAIGGAWSRG